MMPMLSNIAVNSAMVSDFAEQQDRGFTQAVPLTNPDRLNRNDYSVMVRKFFPASKAHRPEKGDGDKAHLIPQRRCAITGERRDIYHLIRFCKNPDGYYVPDLAKTLPGRGLWVLAKRGLLTGKVGRKRLGSLLAPRISQNLIDDQLEALLVERCLNFIGLARRSGQVLVGHDKIRTELTDNPIHLLLTAADAGAEGHRKAAILRALLSKDKNQTLDNTKDLTCCLTGAEMGSVFGRGSVVHVAFRPGTLAVNMQRELTRLIGFRANHTHPTHITQFSSPIDTST